MAESQDPRPTAAGQERARRHNMDPAPDAHVPRRGAQSPTARTTAAGREGARRHNMDAASPTSAEIAERAYAIYVANGRKEGEDEQNWREAERQLREGR